MRGLLLANVFTKAVRDAVQWTVIAIVALWLMTLMMVWVFSSFGDEYAGILGDLPPAMAAIYGENDGTPAGIAMSAMFSLMAPIVLLAYAIGLGSSAAVGEEESRTLNLLLTNPLKRAGVMASKVIVVLMGVLLIALFGWLGVEVSASLFGMEVGDQDVFGASVQLLGLALLFGGLAAGLSAWRGSSAIGIGVAAVVALGSYFITTLLPVVEELADIARLTPWYLYSGAQALSDGVDVALLAVAVVAGGIMLWVGLYTIERRDLKG